MKCTKCKIPFEGSSSHCVKKIFSSKQGEDLFEREITLCWWCTNDIISELLDLVAQDYYNMIVIKYGKEIMPKAFLKMKRAMIKQYGKRKGETIASKTWNKQHKGTGQTVGRGRK